MKKILAFVGALLVLLGIVYLSFPGPINNFVFDPKLRFHLCPKCGAATGREAWAPTWRCHKCNHFGVFYEDTSKDGEPQE